MEGRPKYRPKGGKPRGYSLNKDGKKICDDDIKENILLSIDGDEIYYGYRKITYHLRHKYMLVTNTKKVYRLCKELGILKNQRVIKPKIKCTMASNRTVTDSNQLWKMDIKYSYIQGEDKFFYMFNIIDIFDRIIVDYNMGFHCEAKDAASLLKYALMKRNLYGKEYVKPVIRTDDGPRFVSYRFKE
ncbi:DDE-type integrase/transposase/recombinase [Clostridium tyrobutyricum]|uniref:DDE-type integrase/transposase/recombinase n=1 Tax=Clostridium tyrobutyricum TaxID=1519 RepID=UPI0018A99A69